MLRILESKLCHLLQIENPIIQAGMAGGATTVDLLVGVSEAGGLATLGAAYMKPEDIRKTIKEVKSRVNKPFAVNLFCTTMDDNLTNLREVQSALNSFRQDLNITYGNSNIKTESLFDEQFQVLLDEKIPIISTAFGHLSTEKMQLAKERGIKVITMVTTVNEAILAEQAGSDVIVAQGSDAGGHRSTFDINTFPNGANIGTFSLVPQVVDHVNVPVVAAGGIMDARGIVASLALGAQGVQMGTQFLTCKESGIHPAYKDALLQSNEESTVITKSFSGRPARGIKNKFISEFENLGIEPLPFPSQNTLTTDIRKAAAKQNNPDYMSLWAGQATRLQKGNISAKQLICELMDEVKQMLGKM
ncbi:NAD(P)H-dependent flavin oxidoreductase [Metabacillus herbersteinensis]|uniref:Probable nitronate monooxygenase n=1 Tax=Metabacillus herbersteinensis TaxID=283816 RepID=A0ABV6GC57_9BACI